MKTAKALTFFRLASQEKTALIPITPEDPQKRINQLEADNQRLLAKEAAFAQQADAFHDEIQTLKEEVEKLKAQNKELQTEKGNPRIQEQTRTILSLQNQIQEKNMLIEKKDKEIEGKTQKKILSVCIAFLFLGLIASIHGAATESVYEAVVAAVSYVIAICIAGVIICSSSLPFAAKAFTIVLLFLGIAAVCFYVINFILLQTP